MGKVLIVTATKVEAQEVLDQFTLTTGAKGEPCYIGRKTYYALGDIGGVDLFMVQSEMGTSGPGAALLTVAEGIQDLSPVAVIMVGICFGAKRKKQKRGHILVSKQLHSYEPKRESVKGRMSRGDKVTASGDLLDKFRSADLLWKGVPVHFGLILSGEKLIDDPVFLQGLLEEEPEAIGGEMEGAGLYAAARDAGVDWIIVKAICDWADGKKNDKYQQMAARNAVAFTLHVIQQGGLKHLRLSGNQTASVSDVPRTEADGTRCPIPSTIPGRYGKPFVGRDDELAEMLGILGDTSREMVLVLHGQSGAGKSELGFEFARTQQARYPGGTFLIRAGSVGAAVDLAGVGKNILGLQFAPDLKLEDQCQKTLHALGSAPTLLVYDNVIEPGEIQDLLPPAGRPCHVIITTVFDAWHPSFPIIHVHPLPDEKAFDLVKAIGGAVFTEKYGQRVVEISGGLPIQICPMAEILKREHGRGLDESVEFSLSDHATASFRGVYERLNPDQRLLLHAAAHLNPQRIRRDALFRHLGDSEVMNENQIIKTLDACMDLTLLQGSDELRMHQLMVDFIRGVPLQNDQVGAIGKVRRTQAKHFLEVACKFGEALANSDLAADLTSFPLSIEAWRDISDFFGIYGAHAIGYALHELGRWNDALPWYQRAVRAGEMGDIFGRVDHESLGASLHQVGLCYYDLGKFYEALPWFKRAVKVKRKCDIHRKMDHRNLGVSLHQVGMCYSNLGEFKEALLWLQRAVQAHKRGDKHGRVHRLEIGKSLHEVGMCYWNLGEFKQALPWFRRAIRAGEMGDICGRIDHESLGTSLHQMGICYSNFGKFKEAVPWLERAVQSQKRGDEHGRVNQDSLGRSLHHLGICYDGFGKSKEALRCFKRSVQAVEKGDIYGRVDQESLGKSLNEVGICYWTRGKFKEALTWFGRAVKAKEKGDVYGIVDEESLRISWDYLLLLRLIYERRRKQK